MVRDLAPTTERTVMAGKVPDWDKRSPAERLGEEARYIAQYMHYLDCDRLNDNLRYPWNRCDCTAVADILAVLSFGEVHTTEKGRRA